MTAAALVMTKRTGCFQSLEISQDGSDVAGVENLRLLLSPWRARLATFEPTCSVYSSSLGA
jgi:hypothetical protein